MEAGVGSVATSVARGGRLDPHELEQRIDGPRDLRLAPCHLEEPRLGGARAVRHDLIAHQAASLLDRHHLRRDALEEHDGHERRRPM